MSEIILSWLTSCGLDGVTSFERDFANGYRFGFVLNHYGFQTDFDSFRDESSPTAMLNNYRLLEPSLRQLSIRWSSNLAKALMTETTGAAKNLLYQLRMALEKIEPVDAKQGLNQTAASLASQKMTATQMTTAKAKRGPSASATQTDKFYEHQLREKMPRKIDQNLDVLLSRFKDQEKAHNAAVVAYREEKERERQDRVAERRRGSLQKQLETRQARDADAKADEERHAQNMNARWNAEQLRVRFEEEADFRDRKKQHNETINAATAQVRGIDEFEATLQRLGAGEKREKAVQDELQDPIKLKEWMSKSQAAPIDHLRTIHASLPMPEEQAASNETHMQGIRQRKSEELEAAKERERRRRKVLVEQQQAHMQMEEQHVEDLLLERLQRQSKEERRLVQNLMQTRGEKDRIRENRLQREAQYSKQRETDAAAAAERDAVLAAQAKAAYLEQMNIELLRHKELFQQREAAEAAVRYRDCLDVLNLIVGVALKTAEYREMTGGLVPRQCMREWTTLFLDGRPLLPGRVYSEPPAPPPPLVPPVPVAPPPEPTLRPSESMAALSVVSETHTLDESVLGVDKHGDAVKGGKKAAGTDRSDEHDKGKDKRSPRRSHKGKDKEEEKKGKGKEKEKGDKHKEKDKKEESAAKIEPAAVDGTATPTGAPTPDPAATAPTPPAVPVVVPLTDAELEEEMKVIPKTPDELLDQADVDDYLAGHGDWLWATEPEVPNTVIGDAVRYLLKATAPPPPEPVKPVLPAFPVRLAVVGKPLAGKTAVAERLAEKYVLDLLSPDKLIAAAVAAAEAGETQAPPIAHPAPGQPSILPRQVSTLAESTGAAEDEPSLKRSSSHATVDAHARQLTATRAPSRAGKRSSKETKGKKDDKKKEGEPVTPAPVLSERATLGLEAKALLAAGKEVDDAIVIGLIVEATRRSEADTWKGGWIIDNYPNNAKQAQALEHALTGWEPRDKRDRRARGKVPKDKKPFLNDKTIRGAKTAPPSTEEVVDPDAPRSGLDYILRIEIDDPLSIRRTIGRRLDPETGQIFHLEFSPPPPNSGISDRLVPVGSASESQLQHALSAHAREVKHLDAFVKDFSGASGYAPLMLPVDGNVPLEHCAVVAINTLEAMLARRGEEKAQADADAEAARIAEAEKKAAEDAAAAAKAKEEAARRAAEQAAIEAGEPLPDLPPEPEPEENDGEADKEKELGKDTAMVLVQQWGTLESLFLGAAARLFRGMRYERHSTIHHMYTTKVEFQGYLNAPDPRKQRLVEEFQIKYNKMHIDLRGSSDGKAELHMMIEDVKDALWMTCDTRLAEAEAERAAIVEDRWLEDRAATVANYFIGLMQLEVDRYQGVTFFAHDFYTLRQGRIPEEGAITAVVLPLIPIPTTAEPPARPTSPPVEAPVAVTSASTEEQEGAGVGGDASRPTSAGSRPGSKGHSPRTVPKRSEKEKGASMKVPAGNTIRKSPSKTDAKPKDAKSPASLKDPKNDRRNTPSGAKSREALAAANKGGRRPGLGKAGDKLEDDIINHLVATSQRALGVARGEVHNPHDRNARGSPRVKPGKSTGKEADKSPAAARTAAPRPTERKMSGSSSVAQTGGLAKSASANRGLAKDGRKKKKEDGDDGEAPLHPALVEEAEALRLEENLLRARVSRLLERAKAVVVDLIERWDATCVALDDWLGARFRAEMAAVSGLVSYARAAVEEESLLRAEILLEGTKFEIDEGVLVIEPEPVPPVPPPVEDKHFLLFTCTQLLKFAQHFRLAAPGGLLPRTDFIGMVMRMQGNAAYGNDDLPARWLELQRQDVQSLAEALDPLSIGYLDWRELVLLLCVPRRPSMDELMVLKWFLTQQDPENRGRVSRTAFLSLPLWTQEAEMRILWGQHLEFQRAQATLTPTLTGHASTGRLSRAHSVTLPVMPPPPVDATAPPAYLETHDHSLVTPRELGSILASASAPAPTSVGGSGFRAAASLKNAATGGPRPDGPPPAWQTPRNTPAPPAFTAGPVLPAIGATPAQPRGSTPPAPIGVPPPAFTPSVPNAVAPTPVPMPATGLNVPSAITVSAPTPAALVSPPQTAGPSGPSAPPPAFGINVIPATPMLGASLPNTAPPPGFGERHQLLSAGPPPLSTESLLLPIGPPQFDRTPHLKAIFAYMFQSVDDPSAVDYNAYLMHLCADVDGMTGLRRAVAVSGRGDEDEGLSITQLSAVLHHSYLGLRLGLPHDPLARPTLQAAAAESPNGLTFEAITSSRALAPGLPDAVKVYTARDFDTILEPPIPVETTTDFGGEATTMENPLEMTTKSHDEAAGAEDEEDDKGKGKAKRKKTTKEKEKEKSGKEGEKAKEKRPKSSAASSKPNLAAGASPSTSNMAAGTSAAK